ncbi:carboxypeptidase-like regulatory domain-containing protein [Pendulispora brunnea]|uniref:Carboxypeptidase-like regulatory domain-containing protein n=1 Tax=Pendulispora brunnea TaxID=2905690 RepID=A0ABZ2K8J8_9BACT
MSISRWALFMGGASLLVAGCTGHDDASSNGGSAITGKTPVDTPQHTPDTEPPPHPPEPPIPPPPNPPDTSPPGPNDVVGIVQGRTGGPVVGVKVASGGFVTKSDSKGRFILRNVPPKYDVYCGIDGQGDVYSGLTTRAPTIRLREASDYSYPAQIRIDYNPSPSPPEIISFAVRDDIGTESLGIGPGYPAVFWPAPAPELTGQFFALEYERPAIRGGPPTHYTGLAFAPMRLRRGGQTVFQPTFSPVPSTMTVTGVARPAPGTTIYETFLYLSFGGSYGRVNSQYPGITMPAQFVVPEVPGASWAIEYSAYETGAPGSFGGAHSSMIVPISADGSVPEADVPAPAKMVLPARDATNFDVGSEIAWANGQGTCQVAVSRKDTTVYITTVESHIVMPDLAAVGVPFGRGERYFISVWCNKPASRTPDTDPVLDPSGPRPERYLGTSTYSRSIGVSSPP